MPTLPPPSDTHPTLPPFETTAGNGIGVEAVRLPGRYGLRAHTHGHLHLCYVQAGRFEEEQGHTLTTCVPGTLRISRAEVQHNIEFGDAGATCLVFDLTAPHFADAARPWAVLDCNAFFRHPMLGRMAEAIAHRAQGGSALAALDVEIQLLELLAKAAQLHTRGALHAVPAWLLHARALVASAEGVHLNVGLLARRVGVHRVHLARTFLRHHGCSVRAYLHLHRMKQACRLLGTTDAPLATVALEAGFADQSHLTNALKRHLNVTPRAYRVTLVQEPHRVSG